MCGIAGFASPSTENTGYFSQPALDTMSAAIDYRGPDSSGSWIDAQARIALAHRRLAITDLSVAGHQPMWSPTQRYVLVFNGEIYNHLELRKRLPSVAWRGHSDTETILAGFDAWGIRRTLNICVGMFALAVWDTRESCLTLARDRFGEKPLYYGHQRGFLLFGSELKAVRAHPSFAAQINRDALTLYMRYGYIPAPYSIYADIYKLEPGHLVQFKPSTGDLAGSRPEAYWSLTAAIKQARTKPFAGTETEAINELDARLRNTVRRQMIADVPLGAFLSGGIDSSTVIALMQTQSPRPVQTFTIGFQAAGYDEADHARAIAKHLGTEHTEFYVSPDTVPPVIERLPFLYDEPFADSSQIPTFLVSQLTREKVTVGVSGDGGDELFGGYNRHIVLPHLWRRFGYFPAAFRELFGRTLMLASPHTWSRISSTLTPILPRQSRVTHFGDKLQKLAGLLAARDPMQMYLEVVSHWKNPADIVIGGTEPLVTLTRQEDWPDLDDFEQLMMALDTLSYLPGDILTKVDRASMGVSLETRLPFLDHELAEFVWSLPLQMKIRDGEGKWILRRVLDRYVPANLIERPKAGFAVPIDSLLRGPLRDWAENLLDDARLRQEGFFDPVPIRQKWAEHLSGRRNWQYHLWNVLMFQAWLEEHHGR
jgi:asparagine synthase (glutamine-hydrolysing)